MRADCSAGRIEGSVLALSYEPVLVTLLVRTPSVPGAESEKRYYYHSNHLGSVNVVTDDQGRVVAQREYRSYGDRFAWTGPQSGPRELLLTFDGRRHDDATGLYYFGARHYDAELGRFLTADTEVPDPMNPKALHRYALAGGTAIRYIDLTGHAFWDWVVGIIVIVAVVAAAVVISVAPFGTLSLVSAGFAAVVIGAVLGAALGAAGMGVYALTQGLSPLSGTGSWITMAAGAVLGAAPGAGLVALPSLIAGAGTCVSLFATAATSTLGAALQSAVVGALVDAMFGAVEGTIIHFAEAGGVEELLGKLAPGVAFGAAIGGIGGGLDGALSKATSRWPLRILTKMARKGGEWVLTTTGRVVKALAGPGLGFARWGYAIGTGQKLLPTWNIGGVKSPVVLGIVVLGTQCLLSFLSSPQKPTGIPGWAFSGTWPGAGASLDMSDEAALLQTMPLAP